MPTVTLTDRALIAVDGEEAEHFLQNLITTDLDALAAGECMPGALLTPQGKILFDFLVSRDGDGFRLECRGDVVADFVKRLTLYKLRAKVEISESDQPVITVSWDDDSDTSSALLDRRFAQINVTRHYGTPKPDSARVEDWHAFRIKNGIGESGLDYELGDAFPHDILFDQNGGVSFRKGCFVGQEVVSRMQHRGTARKRLLMTEGSTELPPPGTEINADGRTIGTLGSGAGTYGLAMVRIDRVAKAETENIAIKAGEAELKFNIPIWADIAFPASNSDADKA